VRASSRPRMGPPPLAGARALGPTLSDALAGLWLTSQIVPLCEFFAREEWVPVGVPVAEPPESLRGAAPITSGAASPLPAASALPADPADPADPAGPAAVRAESLVVLRGGRVVLDGLTFTIASGRVTGLLGPSGCGKTTLMRALVGVQVIAAGRAELLGLPAGDPRLRHRIGYATQDPAVYTDLTLAENLRYFGTVLGLSRPRLAAVIARTVAELDLGDVENRLVGTFSGGQLARAGLAVALLGKPGLLVLDEPTVGLDPVLRRDLWAMFHRLAAAGTALLVSSHVMDEAARCDHLLFMREGRFLATGSPKALLESTGAADLESAFLYLATQHGERR
jgi:ABC-2 type transport system ATP-binding protein